MPVAFLVIVFTVAVYGLTAVPVTLSGPPDPQPGDILILLGPSESRTPE